MLIVREAFKMHLIMMLIRSLLDEKKRSNGDALHVNDLRNVI
jgi:hypothetical protein